MVLRVTGLGLKVPGRWLFRGLDLELAAGQSVAVMGSSGVGKTALLRAILGLRPIDEGVVEVCGVDVGRAKFGVLARLRADSIGMVYQDARALMNKPALLLADEPTGSLDAELKDEVADLIFTQATAHKCALVVVTHDPQIAARADTTIKLTPPPTQPDPHH